MFDALYVGATGMRGQQLQIDTIAHNLANLNTVGYRRSVTTFAEISSALSLSEIAAISSSPGISSSLGIPTRGAGSIAQVSLSSLAGELKATGEPLDIAIDGLGFLEVIRHDGTPAYTRNGKLKVDADGMLATADGAVLSSQIQIPFDAEEVRIGADGRVFVVTPDDPAAVEVGRVELALIPNPSALKAVGDNLFVAPAQAGEPQLSAPGESGLGTIRQGHLESSNVQMADELVTLMLAQRAFEMNARVVQAADQMVSITNSLYR
jgi:flagellar basal-body rod protein FlgG